MTDLKDALTDAGITGTWRQTQAAGEAACSDYGDEGANELNAENRSTPSWASTGVPESDWPQALDTLKRVTSAAGFSIIEVPHDEPGSHDLFSQGPNGARSRLRNPDQHRDVDQERLSPCARSTDQARISRNTLSELEVGDDPGESTDRIVPVLA